MAVGLGSALANAALLGATNSIANATGNLLADVVRRKKPMQVEVTNLPPLPPNPYRSIVTVPHSECPSDLGDDHGCDVFAPALANAIALPGDEVLPGDRPKTEADYSSEGTRKSRWHRKLTALLRGKAFRFLIDVHSQPDGAALLNGSQVSLTHTLDRRAAVGARMMAELLNERGIPARRQIAGVRDSNFVLRRAAEEGVPAIAVDISEDAPRGAIAKLAEVVNEVRGALFEPVRVAPQANPPSVHLVPIRTVLYDCDGPHNAQAGLCMIHPAGKEWFHDFERNAPLYDRSTGIIHGLVMVKGDGINDWPNIVPPQVVDNTFNRPVRRISRLKGLILADGTEVPLWGKSLWTDATGTRLFVIGSNPSGTLGPVPMIGDEADAVEIVKRKGKVGFYFFGEGCSGCDAMKPLLDRVVQKFDYLFAVDWKIFGKLGEALGVVEVPQIVIYESGRLAPPMKGKDLILWARALPEESPVEPVAAVSDEQPTIGRRTAMLVVREKEKSAA